MSKELVFVGGGHAHLTALVRIPDYINQGHRVTLVSPVTHHYYSGMGPGMLSGMYAPEEARFHVKKMAEDRKAKFILGRVVRVRPDARLLVLQSGEEVGYDVVSFNTGSSVRNDVAAGPLPNCYPAKPVSNLLKAQKAIREHSRRGTLRIVVAGGGPAGVELTGNAQRLVANDPRKHEISLISGGEILPGLPPRARQLALSSLARRGVAVLENARLTSIEREEILLENGERIGYDIVLLALGVRPSTIFRDSGMPVGDYGGLLVNDYLQSVEYPEIFGGGDCVSFQSVHLDKVGVYAVRQNPILYGNLMAGLNNSPMERFIPQKTYLLIFNLGDGAGVFVRGSWVWNGRLALRLKDYIDRGFMKKFQLSGERDDPSEIVD